ncbi:MAG TPA: hypothetical protein VE972_10450 [Conexibacter sp.]|nr:hypothetical protein [Conexibacter sp.]
MELRKPLAALLALGASFVFASAASAAFPDYTGCPRTISGVSICVDVQDTSGALNIKGFNVPLGRSLEIRGGFIPNGTERPDFVPATGTNGFISQAVPVPGGLLGIEWLPGNSVLAITELAGSPSAIHFDVESQGLSVPVKVRLVNVLLGMDCHIGTNSRPVVLNFTTGTTSPPAPNRPIRGHLGEISSTEEQIFIRDVLDVENSFAVPGATECGLGLGLINTLVNLKLRLPSAAGNNSVEVHNDIALRPF